ncbi:DUF1778 domain-containing protein [Variovorax sp. KK3]|uniref:type II toxin -antitoxin system TacA 1-like antitoxin n=1 Tax=Variovorax sp. KK3 TaxID=1855728 RepID=UPI00356B38E0
MSTVTDQPSHTARERDVIRLSDADWAILVEVQTHSPPPNAELREAFARYEWAMGRGARATRQESSRRTSPRSHQRE